MGLEPSVSSREPVIGVRYLICSDGITDMLSDGEIADILSREAPVEETAGMLLERALKKGGRDNITLVLCEVKEKPKNWFGRLSDWIHTENAKVIKLKNRMQDLDFEQVVAFDSVKDFEFTRKAAQKLRQVVSLDGFEDEDADVIFHYLYKEMELVSFGDHLKRYIYERAGLEEPYSEVTQDIYKDIVIESFHETCTPKSMNPTSTKLTSLVNNWLSPGFCKKRNSISAGIWTTHAVLRMFQIF